MKNSKNIKQAVFTIGFLALLVGVFGAIADKSIMNHFLSIHTGFMLIGTVLLHKEEDAKPCH